MFFDKSDDKINKDDLIPRKDFEKLQQVVDVHQDYINNLYVFYKLKPTPFLECVRNLSYEFLRFFDGLCEGHELTYWLDYGTLLGSVRHDDFIPWDDDLDVGMMREDYMRLTEILDSSMVEFENMSVDNSGNWIMINYDSDELGKTVMSINVFPYDYIEGNPMDNFEEMYNQLRENISSIDVDGMYDSLGLTFNKNKYYIAGIEGIRGKSKMHSFKIVESDGLFPLVKSRFGKYDFPAPNDSISYARDIYGKRFIKIPKKKPKQTRLARLMEIENIEEILERSCEDLKGLNDNYDF